MCEHKGSKRNMGMYAPRMAHQRIKKMMCEELNNHIIFKDADLFNGRYDIDSLRALLLLLQSKFSKDKGIKEKQKPY